MPISSQALASIQAAGSAVFAADTELKNVVDTYASQVHQALQRNAFDLGNDGLFEEWKLVARLSQAMSQIESDLRKIYSSSQDLANSAAAQTPLARALPAPAASGNAGVLQAFEAVDVVVKKPRQKRRSQPLQALKGNKAKLLETVVKLLNSTTFTKVNRSQIGAEAGLAKGSVATAFIQLVQAGHLLQDMDGGLKLRPATPQ